MAANRSKRKQKDESGSKLGEKGKAKAKPTSQVARVTPVTNTATVEPPAPAEQPATVEKPEKPITQTAPKQPTVPGVRPMRARPYLAGTIIAKHGLAAGVTEAMVTELDQAYGKPNPTESRFCLKNAHHAARGYLGIAEGAVK